MHKKTQKIILFICKKSTAVLLAFLLSFSPVFPFLSQLSLVIDDIGNLANTTAQAVKTALKNDFSTHDVVTSNPETSDFDDVKLEFDSLVEKYTNNEQLALTGAPETQASASTDNLRGYWKFDDGSGTTAIDSSDHNNHGTLTGGPTWSASPTNSISFTNPYALTFDGTNDYVNTTANIGATLGGTGTLSAWVKTSQTGSSLYLSSPGITGVVTFGSFDEAIWGWLDNSGLIGFTGLGGANVKSTTAVNDNAWHHVAITRNSGSGTVRVLVDGTLEGNSTSGTGTVTQSWTSIGRIQDTGGSPEYFNGTLDDVRIYDRVLSVAEVGELANGTHTSATWDGSSSTNWETAANWDIGAVPDNYTNITIADTSNDPKLTANVEVVDLTINSSAKLDIAGFNLTFNDAGTFANSGTFQLQGGETLNSFTNDSDSGTVFYTGTSNQTGLVVGDTYNNLIINDGLVGYWKFDEGTGTSVADSSGYDNTGTLSGTPAWSASPTNNISFTNPYALSFDGTDDVANMGDPSGTELDFGASTDFTLSAWINPSNVTGAKEIVNKKDGGATTLGYGYRLNDNNLEIAIGDGSTNINSTTTSSVSASTWSHVVVTFDRSGNAVPYVNGVAGTGVSISAVGNIGTTTSLRVGRRDTGNFFAGIIDDVRIYNRALSASEISALAAGDAPASATATYTLDANLDVNGDFTLASGGVNTSGTNYSINTAGSLQNYGGVLTTNASTITLDGTATGKTLQTGGSDIYNLTVNGSGGGWTLADRLDVTNALTISAGTLDTSTSNYNITTADFDQTGGTFTANSSTLTLNSSSAQTLNFSSSLYNLNIEDPTEVDLVGYWKFDEGQGTTAYDSSSNSNNGTLTNGPTWTTTIPSGISFENPYALDFDGGDDYVELGTISSGNPLMLNGTDATISVWVKPQAGDIFQRIIDKSNGSNSANGYSLFINGNTGSNGELVFQVNSTWSKFKSGAITNGSWNHVVARLVDTSDIALYVNGTELTSLSTTGSPTAIPNVETNMRIGTWNHSTAREFKGQMDDLRIYSAALDTTEISNLANGYYADGDNGTATFTLNTNLDVDNDITLYSGILAGGSNTITVGNDWVNRAGASAYSRGTSTVTLDGTNQTLIGSTAFYNLTKTESSNDATDSILTFTEGTTTTISNTWTVDGLDADDNINLVSSNPGTQWNVDPQGTRTLDYIDVTDSNNTNATAIDESGDATVANGDNNTNWTFVSQLTFSGTVYSDEGVTNIGTGKTVRIAINGTDYGTTDDTDASGAWSIANVPVASGDVVTAYLEDETEDAVTVTVSDGATNITGLDLYQNYLITRHDNSGSLTNSNLSTAAVGSEDDISNIYSVASGNLTTASGISLYIPSGHTFAPGGNVSVGGHFKEVGAFTESTNTVTLTGSTGGTYDIVTSGSLYNLTLNDGGNGTTFELEDNLDVDNDLTITGGTLDTKSTENNPITVGGSFSNADTFTPNSSVVALDAASGTETITAGGSSLYDLAVTNGLVGYWKLDEGTGTSAADSSGHGNTGALSGGPTWSASPTNDISFTNPYALDFDGVDDYVDIGDPLAGDYSEMTVCTWVKNNNTTFNPAEYLISQRGSESLGWWELIGRSAVAGYRFEVKNTSLNEYYSPTFAVSDTNWHFLCGTYSNKTNKVQLYGDGVAAGTASNTTGTPTPTVNAAIGSIQGASLNNPFGGTVDDVRIYNRVLSSTEVATLAGGDHLAGATYSLSDSLDVTNTLTIANGTLDLNAQNLTTTGATFSNDGTLQLDGSETLTNFTNDTDSGTVLYTGTSNQTGLAAGDTYNDLIINDGLVGYWKFDEGSGTTAADSSGYGNTGTLTNMDGGTDWVTGTTDINFTNPYSLDFDGTDDYVSISDDPSLQFGTGAFAASFWFNVSNTNTRGLLSKSSTSGFEFYQVSNRVAGYLGGTNIGYLTPSSSVAIDTWYHFAFSREESGLWKAYLGGVQTSSTTDGDDIDAVSENVYIGARTGGAGPVNGLLDDVRIYNRALSSTEVSSLAAGTAPASATATYTLDANLDVNGDFTLAAGGLNTSGTNYSINEAGSLLNYGGVLTTNASTVTLDGTSTGHTLQTGGSDIYNLTVNGSGGGWTLADRLDVTNALAISAGTLDTSTDNHNISTADFDQTGGTFTTNSSTLTLNSSSAQTVNFSSSLYNLNIEDPTESNLVGYWKFDEGQGTTAYDSGTGGNDGTLTNGPSWTSTVPSGIGFDNPYALDFDGTDDYVDASGVATTMQSESSWTISLWAAATSYTAGQAAVSLNAGGVNFSSFILYPYDTNGGNGVRAYFNGTGIIDNNSQAIADGSFHHFLFVSRSATDHEVYVDGVSAGTSSTSKTLSGSLDQFNIGAWKSGSQNFDGQLDDIRIYDTALDSTEVSNLANGYYANGDSGTATYTLNTNLDVDNDLALYSGILAGGSNTVTVGNDWINQAGASGYSEGTSTVSFDNNTGSSEQQVLGSTTFYNFTKTVTNAAQITFEAAKTFIINGLATLTGAVSNLLSIRSTTTDTAYNLDLQGTESIQYADIKDANNTSGDTAYATNSTDSGGNTDIVFNAVIWDGGGGDNNWSTSANWTGDVAPTSSEIAVFNGTSTKDATIDTAINVQGISIESGYTGTITQGTSSVTVGSSNFDQAAGTFTGGSGTMDINGTFTLSTGTFTATSGSWTQAGNLTISGGTFSANTGTLTLDATSGTNTITSNSNSFYNLTLNDGGGTAIFQLEDALDVDNDLTITGGTLDTKSGEDNSITVGGSFSNADTFTPQSGTVTLDGIDQALVGDTTFYNLTKTESTNNSTDSILTFTAGDTFTITNVWTLDGFDADDQINLVSSSPGTQWSIDSQGTRALDNINVTDSNNANATAIDEYADSTVVDGGNNNGWIFSTTALYTWRGDSGDLNWSTNANWVGGTAPGSGNVATFDGTSTNSATIDTAIDVAGIDINSGYTGTITQGTSSVTVGSSNFDQAAGTFTGGSGTIDINGTFTLSAGTFTATSGSWTQAGNLTISGGTFDDNDGTLTLDATSGTNDVVSNSNSFYNLILNDAGGSATFELEDALDVDNNLTITGGTLDTKSGEDNSITVGGSFSNADTFTAQSGTVTLNGTSGTLDILSGGSSFYNLTLNDGGGTATFELEDALDVDNNLTITGGTLDTKSGENNSIAVGGSFSNADTFTVNASTVTFNASSGTKTITSNSTSFYNVTFNDGGGGVTYTLQDDLDVNNDLVITSVGTIDGNIITVAGDVTSTDAAVAGTTRITLDGTGSQTITASGADFPNGAFWIDKASGVATLASALTLNGTGQTITIQNGTLDLAGYDATTVNGFSVVDTLQMQGTETVTAALKILQTDSTVIYTGDGDGLADTYVITSNFTGYENLTINSTDGTTDTYQLGSNITVGANFSNNGTLDTTTNTATITLDATDTDNTFNPGTSSIYNLTTNGSGGAWNVVSNPLVVDNNLTLTNGTLDINGQNLTVTGTFSNNATLRLLGTETVTLTNDPDSGAISYDNTATLTDFPANLDDTYYNLIIAGTGIVQLAANLDVDNDLTINSGATLDMNGFDMNIAGDFANSGTLSGTSGQTITLDGTTQTFNPSNMIIEGILALTGLSGTVSLGSNFTISNLLTIAAGRTLSLINFVLTLTGNITNSGTVNEGSGYIAKSSSGFYIADNSYDEDALVSLDNENLYFTVTDEDGNLDGTSADTITSAVTVTCSNDSETVSLTETGNATEVFRYTAGLTLALYDGSATNDDGTLECTDGETISATYTDPQDSGDTQTDTSTATTTVPPAAPSGLSGSADSATAITWTWTDNASNEIGFRLYNADTNALIATIATADTTSYQETGLSGSTTYNRYVRAYNNAAPSSASNTASATTDAAITTPTAPSNFAGSADSATAITWTWTDNSSDETGFKLYNGSDNSLIATIATANATSYQETGLTANTSYSRYLKAYNGSGDSSATSTVSVTTDTSEPPASFSLISPDNGAVINTQTPTFSFYKAQDDDDGIDYMTLTIDGTKNYTIPGSSSEASSPGTGTHSTSTFTAQYFNENDGNPSNDRIVVTLKESLDTGSHSWYVTATDNAGNNTESGSRTFAIDITNPVFVNFTDITTNNTQPNITIEVSDNYALEELTVTLEKATTLLGVIVSYQAIETTTFPISGTSAAPVFTPQNPLEQDARYRVSASLNDAAGNVTESSIALRTTSTATTDRQDAAEDVAQLDTETATTEEIIDTIRELLPDSPIDITSLEESAALRREKQAEAFQAFIGDLPEKIAVWILERGGATKNIFLAILEFAGNARDVLANAAQAVLAFAFDALNSASQRLAFADWLPAILRYAFGITHQYMAYEGASLAYNNVAAPFVSSRFAQVHEFLITTNDLATNNLNTLTGNVIGAVHTGYVTAVQVITSSTSNALEVAQDTRVRTGLRNRQRINEAIAQVWEPVQNFVSKTALLARYNYEIIFDKEPSRIMNVRITHLAPTSATVEWQTNHLTRRGKVNYGTDPDQPYTQEVFLDTELSTHHTAEITGLAPGQTYYFEVMNQNGDYVFDAYYSLTTPKEGEVNVPLAPQDVLITDTEPVSVYKDPNPEADVVYTASEGERLRALTILDGWVSVLLPNRTEGWMLRDSVEFVNQQQPSASAGE